MTKGREKQMVVTVCPPAWSWEMPLNVAQEGETALPELME